MVLAHGFTAVGLVLAVVLWRVALSRVSVARLGRLLGRPRVLVGALVCWGTLTFGQFETGSGWLRGLFGLLAGLCVGVVLPAIFAVAFYRRPRRSSSTSTRGS